MKADVVVLGAGPTGASVSAWLARAGVDVLMVDRNDPPLDGVGESLLPLCVPPLEALGVDMSGFLTKHGATFTRDDRAVRFDFSDAMRDSSPTAWHVKRSVFDERVRDVARESGARFLRATVQGVDLPGIVHTSEGPIQAGLVVDAMGRNLFIARHLGLRRTHPTLRNASTGAWFSGVVTLPPEHPGDVTICAFEGGWFWFIPLDDDTHSVGFVSTPDGPRGKDAFARALALCPAAAARLADATRLHPLRHFTDFTVTSTAVHGDGWVLAGDASGFLDPVFSSGLCLCLGLSQLLADTITGDMDFTPYEQAIRSATEAFEPAIHSFYDGSFMDVAFQRTESQQPTVRAAIVSLLAGDVFDPDFTAPARFGRRFASMARMAKHAADAGRFGT